MTFRIVVLGGYGNFGKRIARRLALRPGMDVVVAGRRRERAAAACDAIAADGGRAAPAVLDIDAADFGSALAALQPALTIHTSGPFQGQDYRVAQAAIACGSHYADLADGRDFVAGIGALDAAARARSVLVVAGASTVPAISAAALDALRSGFARIDAIDIGIAPGNRTERGLATVAAILGYVGAPLQVWEHGRWRTRRGLQRVRRHRYPAPVGARWLADCDVPDLALLPPRYGARTVTFGAGLELSVLHLGLASLGWLRRAGLVRDWSRYAAPMLASLGWLQHVGSDAGAMHIVVDGADAAGTPLQRRWHLVAERGDGPQIPCTPAVVLAGKLANGALQTRGAQPCMGLFTLGDVMDALRGYAVRAL